MIYKHIKTGGYYRVLYEGVMESDLTPVVIYRNVDPNADTRVWVRNKADFYDGRFEKVENHVDFG
jgi:hypothetical protein